MNDVCRRPPIFISSETKDDLRLAMGMAHYSYGVVAQRFAGLLSRAGYTVNAVRMPQKFKRQSDLEGIFGPVQHPPVHICFRSTENMRTMPIARNICHFAWEFDRLKDSELVSRPITANQIHMLRLMDEIWVPSAYTYEVLRSHGLERLALVPTPVCEAQLPSRQSKAEALKAIGDRATVPLVFSSGLSREENAAMALRGADALSNRLHAGGRIALTICNPGDRRKNLLNLIDGFVLGAGKDDVLIVKLTLPSGPNILAHALFDELRPRFNGPVAMHEPRVLVLCDFLEEIELAALYSLADVYISAAHCEGQNLPLLEAMAHGTLAVATRNTATNDVVDEANAVIIAERRFRGLVADLAGEVAGESPIVSGADRFAIARAVQAAFALSDAERSKRIANARALIARRFSEPAILSLVEKQLYQARSAVLAN